MKVANWGKYPEIDSEVNIPAQEDILVHIVKNTPHLLARGLGRCYGDSALAGHLVSSLKLNCFLRFDPEQGIIDCEAGVSFDDILKTIVPKGWFLPVTPGTKFVTAGGAFASDIHGKNHHAAGTFSDHVYWIDLLTADGEVLRCSKTENAELFRLTAGGMGLTGIILRMSFQLEKIETSFIRQESIKAKNLDEIIRIFDESTSWSKSMAWIDCLSKGSKMGRSIMMRGEFAKLSELKTTRQKNNPLSLHNEGKLNVPFNFPSFVLNSLSVKAFNFLYFNKHPRGKVDSIIHYDTFYYPLDVIHNWNRIYGKNGFTQYQFVLPPATSREGLIDIIELIGKRKMGSFLTVLKLFGKQEENYLRFPMEGYTLAMDFKINKHLWKFLDEMDELVMKYGGRVYLTKDVRMTPEFLFSTYPEAAAFKEKLQQLDPESKFSSLQSERLTLTHSHLNPAIVRHVIQNS